MPALKRTRLTASAWRKANWCINCVLMRVMERRVVIFGSSRKLRNIEISIKINGHGLETVESYKYRGITIDKNMNWTEHIDSITSKISQRLGLIHHVKH